MVTLEWPEKEGKTTLSAFLGCLHWGPYVDRDQQGDTRNCGIQIRVYEFV